VTPRRTIIVALVLALVAQAGQGYAGEPTEVVRKSINKVIDILKNPALAGPEHKKERRDALRQAASESFDFREMAKRSLALKWRDLSPEQRDEFVRLFKDLLEVTYMKRVEKYGNQTVHYTGERVDDGYATVQTVVSDPEQKRDIPMDYRLLERGGHWVVYDVVIEGVSLVNNYRSQFRDILASSSYDELVKRIKKKVKSREDEG
jgi:phospholipid transport system substrate-binding protein